MLETIIKDVCRHGGDCMHCIMKNIDCEYRTIAQSLSKNYRKSITAHWIDGPDEGIWVTICSNCETARPEHEYYLYCPDCGAFMENGE